ncbi:Protein RALF-like 31 [Acorus gramineus]|uniref:Protein RALF-like 31 n=1 Tax=Acorus gramineus TaxID=55184 RepID=A0AAV9B3Y9_ACOGR|nr:Protein RALF-like 31 [Acorus gramineus]
MDLQAVLAGGPMGQLKQVQFGQTRGIRNSNSEIKSDPNVSVTEAADEPETGFLVEASEEVEMDSEINRRVLVGQKSYISYESLKGDAVPCMRPGVSYYECHDLNKIRWRVDEMWRHVKGSRRCEKRL